LGFLLSIRWASSMVSSRTIPLGYLVDFLSAANDTVI
jgi:hypothetical protein